MSSSSVKVDLKYLDMLHNNITELISYYKSIENKKVKKSALTTISSVAPYLKELNEQR